MAIKYSLSGLRNHCGKAYLMGLGVDMVYGIITLKCMVRRRTARGLKVDEGIVRVNVSGLLVENHSLRTLDDDPHVSVL
jgi:hypothetical protein